MGSEGHVSRASLPALPATSAKAPPCKTSGRDKPDGCEAAMRGTSRQSNFLASYARQSRVLLDAKFDVWLWETLADRKEIDSAPRHSTRLERVATTRRKRAEVCVISMPRCICLSGRVCVSLAIEATTLNRPILQGGFLHSSHFTLSAGNCCWEFQDGIIHVRQHPRFPTRDQ